MPLLKRLLRYSQKGNFGEACAFIRELPITFSATSATTAFLLFLYTEQNRNLRYEVATICS
jgi:hypothetical protein